MRWPLPLLAATLCGCAAVPIQPDPRVDPLGQWTVVAVNGTATGGGAAFRFAITPPRGSAQFGCNNGSGTIRVEPGWVVTGDWIITVAGCRTRSIARLEQQGFEIFAEPMAVERHGNGMRLHNRKGTIDLAPAP